MQCSYFHGVWSYAINCTQTYVLRRFSKYSTLLLVLYPPERNSPRPRRSHREGITVLLSLILISVRDVTNDEQSLSIYDILVWRYLPEAGVEHILYRVIPKVSLLKCEPIWPHPEENNFLIVIYLLQIILKGYNILFMLFWIIFVSYDCYYRWGKALVRILTLAVCAAAMFTNGWEINST